jgi:hypothetical protein
MTNRILSIEVRDHSVVPAEAEVHVTVVPERLDAGTEAHGRLVGPRNRYASTVEVAYHLRPLRVPTGRPAITLRAIIPEASLWSPECPHLYSGPVELWQDGQRCDATQLRHGLRYFSVGPRGLRINGRVVPLRGLPVTALDETRAVALRAAGYNLLVAPAVDAARAVWDLADVVGFTVLGRVEAGTPATRLRELAGHPSCLGWLLADDARLGEMPAGTLAGVGPAHAEASRASFLAVPGEARADEGLRRPVLLLVAPGAAAPTQGVLGVVEQGEPA